MKSRIKFTNLENWISDEDKAFKALWITSAALLLALVGSVVYGILTT